MPFLQESEQLLGAPGRMPLAGLQKGTHHLLWGLVGMAAGLARPLLETGGATREIAVHPLIARLAADTVELAELGRRQAIAQVIGDELCPLVHRRCLTPRRGAPPPVPTVPSNCYLCPQTKLLPMCLDRTETCLTAGLSGSARRQPLSLRVRVEAHRTTPRSRFGK
jgi:hypothetical protein